MATKHVAVRLDEQTLARVDALIPDFSTPWHPAKRSDVLRALIHAGLEVQERAATGGRGRARVALEGRLPSPRAAPARAGAAPPGPDPIERPRPRKQPRR
jgi:hypothetical protein